MSPETAMALVPSLVSPEDSWTPADLASHVGADPRELGRAITYERRRGTVLRSAVRLTEAGDQCDDYGADSIEGRILDTLRTHGPLSVNALALLCDCWTGAGPNGTMKRARDRLVEEGLVVSWSAVVVGPAGAREMLADWTVACAVIGEAHRVAGWHAERRRLKAEREADWAAMRRLQERCWSRVYGNAAHVADWSST